MFTGIIEEMGRVKAVPGGGLVIGADSVLEGIEPGASIAVNGTCLTVTEFDSSSFSVDVMSETLSRTNLGLLKPGDGVNLERALSLGRPLGGHLVQGHVDATGKVVSAVRDGEAIIMAFKAPEGVMSYIVEKGFIAVDGISLTVVARSATSFKVSLVDYSLKHTNLGDRRVGDVVNLEVDIIAKYVEQLANPRHGGITMDFLKEHGFLSA
ncbi:riboflavin synthase [Chloroflexota bacterium]